MDFDELVDRYKSTSVFVRFGIILLLAMIYPANLYLSEGDLLDEDLNNAQLAFQTAEARLNSAQRKVSELPSLEERVVTIEKGLEKARKYLPEGIEFDEILATAGVFEKELGVQILRLAPGREVQPNPQVRYVELPVDITVKADFSKVMSFFDKMVHLEKLTHLRNISFEADRNESSEPGTVVARASLILFRDLG